jgi:hypothetical protein
MGLLLVRSKEEEEEEEKELFAKEMSSRVSGCTTINRSNTADPKPNKMVYSRLLEPPSLTADLTRMFVCCL